MDAAPARRRLSALSRQLAADSSPQGGALARAPISESVEVCIIGMGFSGMALTYKLRQAGFTDMRAFEKGSDVGGTWYWNRYPGCACDVESFQYSFQFSKEVEQEWSWTRRYGGQPEILAYANFVADKHDLRSSTMFDTSVTSATYDEASCRWVVVSDRGDRVTARFLFMANGPLSSPATPGITVMPEFEAGGGQCFHTHDWPDNVDLTGKRTAAWCAPRRDTATDGEVERKIKSDYSKYRLGRLIESQGNLGGNAGLTDVVSDAARGDVGKRPMTEMDKAEPGKRPMNMNEMAKVLQSRGFKKSQEEVVDAGGFGIALAFGAAADEQAGDASFGPLADMNVNTRLRAHLTSKIRSVVVDDAIAEALTPSYPVACKRLCITDDYWPTFNRANVTLVDLGQRSIETIKKGGPVDADGCALFDEPLDVLIFATGFNALTGTADGQIGAVRGIGGMTLGQKYAGGIETYLGMMTRGFPNAFMMVGPQSTSVLANMVNAAEQQADYFVELLVKMRDEALLTVDVKKEAEQEWARRCRETTARTVWGGVGGGCRSWYNKANMMKRRRDGSLVGELTETGADVLPFTGGQTRYFELCKEYGFKGLEFR